MQTTLLGLGIALILALVAALVGPIFVDWGRYRTTFETEAARMTGLPVRIGGTIDVRMLPTPSITVRDIEVGSRAAPVFGAQTARAELALGSLMRGEWRAAVLSLDAPEFSLGLDASGKLINKAAASSFDAGPVSVDRVVVTNGSISFDDAVSGGRVALQKIAFDGDIRSLAGQVRGEGQFVAAGQPYKFRLSTSRPVETGMRVHLNVDPTEQALAFELDGNLSLEQGVPRYEGNVVLSRPAGMELASGKTVASEPWRIGAKAKADAHAVLFEQIDAQYGPDERNLRLSGTADLKLGAKPELTVMLSGRQLDLDRTLVDQDVANRRPLAALRGFGDRLGDIGRLPFPVHVGIGVDAVTLSGATLQAVSGNFTSANDGWTVDNFELRAPGFTQVVLAGRLAGPNSAVPNSAGPKGAVEFSGPVSVQSADPKALLTWVQGLELARSGLGPMRLAGNVTLGRDRVSVDQLQAGFDREKVTGSFAYEFPHDGHAAKLAATVKADQFDVDGMLAFVDSAFAGSSFVRPGEVALSADLGHATFAGVEATSAQANVRFDAAGLRIEKLSIGDFGGAAVSANGLIDVSSAPHGTLSLSLDAKKLDGLAALARRFSPETADALMRYATVLTPIRIDASLKADPVGTSAQALGKLAINGTLGKLGLTVNGDASGALASPDTTDIKFKAQLVSGDGALLALLGLDRLLATDKPATTLTLAANGPVGGDLRIDAGITGDGLDAGVSGILRLMGSEAGGTLAVAFSAADMRGVKRESIAFPVFLQSTLALDGGKLVLNDLTGSAGGSKLRGKLALDQDWHVDGAISADSMDVPAMIAAAIGAPVPARDATWSARAFSGTPFTTISGKLRLDAAQATVTPTLAVDKLRLVMAFSPSQVSFDNIAGTLAGGDVTGQVTFQTGPGGVFTHGRLALANGDAGKIMRSGNQAPFAGRVSSQIDFDATGSTPAALIGALRGNGSITLDNAQIATLDPKAIDGTIRAAERGASIGEAPVTDMVTRMLDGGALRVAHATAPIEIATGRARLGKVVNSPGAGDFALAASLDLVEQNLDAHFTLYPAQAAEATQRPEVSVAVKGPLTAPRRTVDASVLIGWLTLQAVDREAKKLEVEEREAKRREEISNALRARTEQAAREQLQQQQQQPTQQAPQAAAPALPPPSMIAPVPTPPGQGVPPIAVPSQSAQAAAPPVVVPAPLKKMPPPPKREPRRVHQLPLQLTPQ